MRHNQLDDLEFKTTRVEDTKLTLAVIPFYVEVNNFLFSFGITNMQEKFFFKFSFLEELQFLGLTNGQHILCRVNTA